MDYIKQRLAFLKIFNTKGFWAGFVIGFFYFAYTFWWYWDTYPLESLGIENRFIAFIVIGIVYLISVTISALFWGGSGFLIQKFNSTDQNINIKTLFTASCFTLAEYIRPVFFSAFWYGSGGSIGSYWPFGNLAYLLVNFEFLSLTAKWWGIYGITFATIFIFASIIFFLASKNYSVFFGILIALVIIFIFQANTALRPEDKIFISLIQTDLPSSVVEPARELEDFKNKLTLVQEAVTQNKDGLIVFPEGANFSKYLSRFLKEDDIKKYFNRLSDKNILIVDSIRVLEEGKFKSRAALIDSLEGLVGSYDKEILTPGGEFLPFLIRWPLSALHPELRNQFKDYREYSKGYGSNVFSSTDTLIGLLICSELISPNKAGESNPDLILVMGSFSFWGEGDSAKGQALSMLKLRAIENQKYVALVSNGGYSYIINPEGKIEKETKKSGYELLTGEIIPNKNRTWYNYVGDWPILLLSSVFFGLGFRKILNDKSH